MPVGSSPEQVSFILACSLRCPQPLLPQQAELGNAPVNQTVGMTGEWLRVKNVTLDQQLERLPLRAADADVYIRSLEQGMQHRASMAGTCAARMQRSASLRYRTDANSSMVGDCWFTRP